LTFDISANGLDVIELREKSFSWLSISIYGLIVFFARGRFINSVIYVYEQIGHPKNILPVLHEFWR